MSLIIQNLTAGYGDAMVFQNLSMEIPQGKLLALMGSNGVGKSTLLKTIMGILPTRTGSLQWNDKTLDGKSPFERARRGLGYVPQGRDIFPFLTVRENLVLGLEARGIKPTAAHIESIASYFPEIPTWFNRNGGDLSGGQQQILALGRILLCEPTLLVLDEPTEGIQPSIVEKIGSVLVRLRDERGLTILLVEQFVDFALGMADNYCLMEHGEITRHGVIDTQNRETIRGQIRL
jgi:urea transport system ATP-binding protein